MPTKPAEAVMPMLKDAGVRTKHSQGLMGRWAVVAYLPSEVPLFHGRAKGDQRRSMVANAAGERMQVR